MDRAWESSFVMSRSATATRSSRRLPNSEASNWSREFGPNNRVVGRPFGLARVHVNFSRAASFCQNRRGQNVVDPPSKVSLEGVSKIIPIRILDLIWMEPAKDVDEPPGSRLFVG